MGDLIKRCEQCQRLGLEVSRLLGVVDQLQRALSTLQIERPLTLTVQVERRRVAELEVALREALDLADSGWRGVADDHHHEHRADVDRLRVVLGDTGKERANG